MTTLRSPLASITVDDNATHVIETIRRIREFRPVVLVGTSGGGATISVVGNRVPELIAGIVYVSGWCCVELLSVAAYLASLGHHGVAETMANWHSADPTALAALKRGLMADATDDRSGPCLNLLEPADSAQVLTADSRVQAATWGRIHTPTSGCPGTKSPWACRTLGTQRAAAIPRG